MFKSLKVRIYPDSSQETLINKTIGCGRFIYNNMLGERKNVYDLLKDDKDSLYNYKYKTEKQYKENYDWLKEVDSVALQQSRLDLQRAYTNYFNSLKKGKKVGFPKFHKKGRKDSYRTMCINDNIKMDFEKHKIQLPKLGWINFRDPRPSFPGVIKSTTVSRTKTGKYFVSVLYEYEDTVEPINVEELLNTTGLRIKGLDMSMEGFFVDENNESPEFVRLYREHEWEIKHLQRLVSKKKLGSKNRQKAQLRLNVIFEKIANSRRDFIEKLSTKLIKENDVIIIETLNMKGMSQTLHLGKSVYDLAWGLFSRRLQEKALEQGKIIILADKWFASSQICHKCKFKNKEVKNLKIRKWTCPNCGEVHQRDQNAAINLREYGLKKLLGQELSDLKPGKTPVPKPVEIASVDDRANVPKKHTLETSEKRRSRNLPNL